MHFWGLSDWYRTGSSRNLFPTARVYKCTSGGSGRRCAERRDRMLGGRYLGVVISKTAIKILSCFTLSECLPLLALHGKKFSGIIVKIGETKRCRESL